MDEKRLKKEIYEAGVMRMWVLMLKEEDRGEHFLTELGKS
jgi:hypothetical protein